jgi:uncharacterized membrane protein YbhN (UPF0104 family)/tRNA A-37 threonylcarbamoyl transferase component Bud32
VAGEPGTGAAHAATATVGVPGNRRALLPAGPPIIDEPPEPRRIRRPADLLRVVFGVGLMLLLLGIGIVAVGTTKGAEGDLGRARTLTNIPLGFVLAATSVVLAVVPIALAVERLYRRDSRRVVDSVLAAAIAYLSALGLNAAIASPHCPKTIKDTLTVAGGTAGHSDAFHIYLVTVVAYLTIIGFGNRHNLQTAVWIALVAYGVVTLINGDATLISLGETILLGRTVALAWRWVRGVVNDRPTGESVYASLADAGLNPVSLRRVPDGEDMRRYVVVTKEHGDLDAIVLDRDQQAAGLLYRLYRRLRLRRPAQRRNLLSLRRMLEQEALMSYSVTAAGIRTPQLKAVRDLGPDTGMLAYELVPSRTLDQLDEAELTDGLLADLWDMIADLHEHQLAHRRLSTHAFLVDGGGRAWLTDLRLGEVAAGRFQQLLDVAEMLTVLSICFGYERTVAAAVERLGEDQVAAALPMLQPVVLTRSTRASLKKSKGLLKNVREAVEALHPTVEPEPVKLERLSPRTLFSIIGLSFAAYLLVAQSNQWKTPTHIGWGWVAVVAGASALTYVAAAMALDGFVPEQLSWPKTIMAQVAASFVSLVAPAAVGGVAVNTRYLQRTGIPTVAAAAAVGAQQIVGLIQHLLLILLFGVIASNEGVKDKSTNTPTSSTVIAIILAMALLVLLIAAIPVLRRFVMNRLRPFFAGVVPRMLDVAQNPAKLATGLGGTVLLSLFNITALWASVKAVSPQGTVAVSFATCAVVFLTGQAAGSVFPTPGGIGGVELALSGLLTGFNNGLGLDVATAAVLLFRILTFWLPVLPGWFCFNRMQKRGEL